MRLYNHFETGTLASRITAFGSSNPYAWDFVDGSTTTTIYDNTHKRGLMAGKFLTGATSAKAMATWTPSGAQYGSQTDVYGRMYLYLSAYSSVISAIAAVVDSGNSIASRVLLLTDGKIRLTNASGATLATSTASIPLGAFVRVEWHITHSVTVGAFAFRVYSTDPEAAVASFDFEVSATAANTGANSQGAQVGWCLSAANQPAMWLDAVEVNTTGWIGPSVSEPAKTFLAWRSPVLGNIDQTNASQNAVNDYITRNYEPTAVGRMAFVSEPRRQGSMSMRFECRTNDFTGGGGSERTTLNAVGTTYTDGSAFWLGLSVLLDPTYPLAVSGDWALLYQLFGSSGGQSTGSPPFALEVQDTDYFSMTVRGGVKASAGATAPRETFTPITPATKGEWHDFLFHVTLSTTSSGRIDCYYKRAKDSAWPVTPTVSDTGINMLTVAGVLQDEWNSLNIYRKTRTETSVAFFGLSVIQPERSLTEAAFVSSAAVDAPAVFGGLTV